MKQAIEIPIGSDWQDKDRRRTEQGNVRTMTVVRVEEPLVVVQIHHPDGPEFDWQTQFRRSRFGSGRANDSFERVPDSKPFFGGPNAT